MGERTIPCSITSTLVDAILGFDCQAGVVVVSLPAQGRIGEDAEECNSQSRGMVCAKAGPDRITWRSLKKHWAVATRDRNGSLKLRRLG